MDCCEQKVVLKFVICLWCVIKLLYLHIHHPNDKCYRLGKERNLYEKEVKEQEARVEAMKAEQKDEYEIKKQVIYYG